MHKTAQKMHNKIAQKCTKNAKQHTKYKKKSKGAKRTVGTASRERRKAAANLTKMRGTVTCQWRGIVTFSQNITDSSQIAKPVHNLVIASSLLENNSASPRTFSHSQTRR